MAKTYEELTFPDDFMFSKILEMKPELCKELLELVLDRKLGGIVSVNREKPIEITANGRGVRFDIYAEADGNGKGKGDIYDVEMQNAKVGSLPKRSRYAQGMIDLNLIERGAEYKELNRSYVIFICNFNLFPDRKHRRHKYTFANLCREDPSIELGDEAEKVFLCTEGTEDDISEDMKAFLRYIAEGKPGNAFTNELEEAVTEAKVHKRWRHEYMTLLEHYQLEREEGRKEGHEEGLREGRKLERERADAEHMRAEEAQKRAEAAEKRIRELEQLLAAQSGKKA